MTNTRVNEIDLLRFIAAMAVLLFHYAFRGYASDNMTVMPYPLLAPAAKYGYLGVQLFFMISGFVILLSARSGSLSKFVTSRLVRLYPAFWICCTITALVTLAIGAPYFSVSTSNYLMNMTMVSGYAHIPFLDGSYWSLIEEIKFYALIAIILAFRKLNKIELYLTLWLAISVVLQFVPYGKLHNILITDYSALFIAGSIYYLVWRDGMSWNKAIVLAGTLMLALYQAYLLMQHSIDYYNTDMNFGIVAGLIVSFYGAMLLVATRRTGSIGNRQWVTLGAITYPLYLIHQHVGLMIFNLLYGHLNTHVIFWGTTIAMIGFAYLINVYLETRLSNQFNAFININKLWVKRVLAKA